MRVSIAAQYYEIIQIPVVDASSRTFSRFQLKAMYFPITTSCNTFISFAHRQVKRETQGTAQHCRAASMHAGTNKQINSILEFLPWQRRIRAYCPTCDMYGEQRQSSSSSSTSTVRARESRYRYENQRADTCWCRELFLLNTQT